MREYGWKRVLLLPVEVVVAALLLLDEILRPLYRPLIRWIAGLAIVARMEAAIRPLPPIAILMLLAVPFGIAEPLKIIGLYWLGTGRFAAGLTTLAFAYGASFLLVERIYHAGREKLLTIRWFAAVIGFIVQLRDAVLALLRATRLWNAAVTLVLRIRVWLAHRVGHSASPIPRRMEANSGTDGSDPDR